MFEMIGLAFLRDGRVCSESKKQPVYIGFKYSRNLQMSVELDVPASSSNSANIAWS